MLARMRLFSTAVRRSADSRMVGHRTLVYSLAHQPTRGLRAISRCRAHASAVGRSALRHTLRSGRLAGHATLRWVTHGLAQVALSPLTLGIVGTHVAARWWVATDRALRGCQRLAFHRALGRCALGPTGLWTDCVVAHPLAFRTVRRSRHRCRHRRRERHARDLGDFRHANIAEVGRKRLQRAPRVTSVSRPHAPHPRKQYQDQTHDKNDNHPIGYTGNRHYGESKTTRSMGVCMVCDMEPHSRIYISGGHSCPVENTPSNQQSTASASVCGMLSRWAQRRCFFSSAVRGGM